MPSTDLFQAVIAQLAATPAVVTAFGDTWNDGTQSGTSKFFCDFAGQATEPYLVAYEVGESYQFMTRTAGLSLADYLANGQMAIRIWQSDRQQARAMGVLVAAALNDQEAAITWTGGTLMSLRMSQALFVPIGAPGPGVPTVFNRLLVFDYEYSSSITEP